MFLRQPEVNRFEAFIQRISRPKRKASDYYGLAVSRLASFRRRNVNKGYIGGKVALDMYARVAEQPETRTNGKAWKGRDVFSNRSACGEVAINPLAAFAVCHCLPAHECSAVHAQATFRSRGASFWIEGEHWWTMSSRQCRRLHYGTCSHHGQRSHDARDPSAS